ncbi:MAG: tRNA (adenosine(37)-N6)-threonylcarbamoyltransferase complex transferase subunit TsaD [Psittacicella sp.]
MYILGIETSCDETGIAIYKEGKGIVANELYTQIPLHSQYGGVVPELASRDHLNKIFPLINLALEKASIELKDINAIAYTSGPGLVGALLVGATVAKTIAYGLNIPAIAINHMEAHLLAPLMEEEIPKFPFLALLVSGGHTQIYKVNKIGSYELLGESIDDAAGESFDKTAKLLGLEYPGGPKISKLAINAQDKYSFKRPMPQGLNFSFSGLKTAASNLIKKEELTQENKASIAKAFENAVIDLLSYKCKKALNENSINELIVSGGVSANSKLRATFKDLLNSLNGSVYYPKVEFSTDNGAMIAFTGYIKFKNGFRDKDLSINVKSRWNIDTL